MITTNLTDNIIKTIAVKQSTFLKLATLKYKYNCKSFDDLIDLLIKMSGDNVKINDQNENDANDINVNIIPSNENKIDEKIKMVCYELYKKSKSNEITFYISLLKTLALKKKITLTSAELEYINSNPDLVIVCDTYLPKEIK